MDPNLMKEAHDLVGTKKTNKELEEMFAKYGYEGPLFLEKNGHMVFYDPKLVAGKQQSIELVVVPTGLNPFDDWYIKDYFTII